MFEKEWNHRNFTWFCEIGFDVAFFGGALPGVYCVPAQVFALGIQMFKLSLSTGVWCVDVCVYRNTEVRCTRTCTKRPKKYLYVTTRTKIYFSKIFQVVIFL